MAVLAAQHQQRRKVMDAANLDQGLAMDEFQSDFTGLKQKARAAGMAAKDLTKATYEQISEKAVNCTQATDRAIRDNPYTALGCAFGIGLLLGAFALRTKVVKVTEEKD